MVALLLLYCIAHRLDGRDQVSPKRFGNKDSSS